MIQKDYILRIIEQMAKVLAKVLFNKEAGNHVEAIKEIENALKSDIGIDPILLDTLPIENIADFFGLSHDKASASIKCILAGQLLKEKADILSDKNDTRAATYYHKALGLLLIGTKNIGYTEVDLKNYYDTISEIEKKLNTENKTS